MTNIGHYLGVSLKNEIILLTICGMLCAMFDESLMDLNSNLREIWSVEFSPTHFTPLAQRTLKFIITGIVVIRSFTVHLYLAFYVVMIWPAVFEEKAGLLLPWLVVGGIKNLLLGTLSLGIGLFVCIISGGYTLACGKFLIKQITRLGPSCYMWFTVLRFYRILKATRKFEEITKYQDSKYNFEKALRRRKVRSMRSVYSLRKNLLKEYLRSASNYEYQLPDVESSTCIFPIIESKNCNNAIRCTPLKVSRSLDALLSMIVSCAQGDDEQDSDEIGIDDSLTPVEKTKRLLRLTDSDINAAKHNKEIREDIFCGLNNNADLCAQIVAAATYCHKSSQYCYNYVSFEKPHARRNSERELRSINMDIRDSENFMPEKVLSSTNNLRNAKIYQLMPYNNKNNNVYENLMKRTKSIQIKKNMTITQTLDILPKNADAEIIPNNIYNTSKRFNNKPRKGKQYMDSECQVSTLSGEFLENKKMCELLKCLTLRSNNLFNKERLNSNNNEIKSSIISKSMLQQYNDNNNNTMNNKSNC
ncbi:uncharacterized protein LOC123295984 [Chrysoperla carnea]|uniref:uncharacterized protein LOC123295984 n=1 Tax=Chrysoperla carnea TaxID=189513 RepID=UPI001D07D286|nr:uncharacterized protein LOC123295984 [Chrysoperla carnea]